MRFYNGDVITTEEKQQKFKNSSDTDSCSSSQCTILQVPVTVSYITDLYYMLVLSSSFCCTAESIPSWTIPSLSTPQRYFLESSLVQSAEFYTVSAKQMRQYHLPYLDLLSFSSASNYAFFFFY